MFYFKRHLNRNNGPVSCRVDRRALISPERREKRYDACPLVPACSFEGLGSIAPWRPEKKYRIIHYPTAKPLSFLTGAGG